MQLGGPTNRQDRPNNLAGCVIHATPILGRSERDIDISAEQTNEYQEYYTIVTDFMSISMFAFPKYQKFQDPRRNTSYQGPTR